MIFKSPLPDVDIPARALTEFVFEDLARHGARTAMVDGPTGRRVTYAELYESVRRLAGGLSDRGFGPGRVLAVMAPNTPEFAVVFHAAALAGGIITTVNPTYTAREVHHQLVDSGAEVLVTVPAFLDTAQAGAEGTSVGLVAVMGEGCEGVVGLADLMGPAMEGQVPVDPDDVVALPYSSGTTGLSKGVMLTHRNLVANILQTLGSARIGERDTLIAVLPFFHIYGMQVLMNTGLRTGATIVTMPRFDLEQFLALQQDYRATRSFVAPPMVLALAKSPLVDRYDLSSLEQVLSGAAPLSAELAKEAADRIGCEVVQGYGMTETSPVTHFSTPGGSRPGAVGVGAPNTETAIVDPATAEMLGPGSDGEVWVRGPQVMKGYLNNPEATASTVDAEGWLHTGDIGHMDSDGYLYIVDRLKELIKYKGFQVPPAELEALLLTHPAVADAAVVGVPDEEAGEIPVGYVVAKPGQQVTGEELVAYVGGRVATYKQLRSVSVVAEIPRSASGKILRRVLRASATTV